MRSSLPIILLIAGLIFASCSQRSLIRPGDTLEVAFEKAMALYERGRYSDAANAFETVVSIGRGTEIGQDAQFMAAQSYFDSRQYILAAAEFQRYSVFNPRSERRETADFMEGFSYYRLSPRYNLDQSDTYRAIEAFQLFISRYPSSERAPEAVELIEEMRIKLAKKSFRAAEQFYRLRYYNAAAIYYGLTLEVFPETKWAELALVNQIRAYTTFAENSVPARQEERFQKAVDAYETYLQLFPRGENRQLAEEFYDNASRGLVRSQRASRNES